MLQVRGDGLSCAIARQLSSTFPRIGHIDRGGCHSPRQFPGYAANSSFVLRFDRKDVKTSTGAWTANRVNEFLAELFASRVRAAVLGQAIPRPHMAWSLTEFSRLLDLPISSLQHECYKLERLGILMSRREGASRRYRVDPNGPSIRELTALVVSALGAEDVLRGTLEEITGLETAFIATTLPLTQSALSGADGSIPLVLIGEIPLEQIDAAQERVAALLGLDPSHIEAVFYLPEDWEERVQQRAPYAVWLLQAPRTHLFGTPVD